MALNLRNIEEWRNWSNGVGFSWEEQAFAEDTGGLVGGGTTWPPRSYACTFCRKEFRSAQALGGHMNIHRRDRARLRQGMPLQNSTSSIPSPQQQHDQPQTIAIPCAIASSNQPQQPSSLLLQRHHSEDDYGNAIPLSWGANNGFTTTYSIVDARPPKVLVPSLRVPSMVDTPCQSPPSTVLSMALQSKFTSNHHESAASSNESSDSSSDSKTNKRKNDMDLDLEISDRHTHTKSFLVSWTNNPNRSVGKKNFIAEIVDLDAPQDLDLELRLGDGSASSSFRRNPSRIHHS